MEQQLLDFARAEGFHAAVISTREIPVDPKFRAFCEENLCGQYGANYSCPPDCGSVEQLHGQLLEQDWALVISTIWENVTFDDKAAVAHAKASHNGAVLRLMERIRQAGYSGFCAGYNGCPLCRRCGRLDDLPCPHPAQRISCMSAYCIDVAQLARQCRLEFGWIPGKLYLFGLIACRKEEAV